MALLILPVISNDQFMHCHYFLSLRHPLYGMYICARCVVLESPFPPLDQTGSPTANLVPVHYTIKLEANFTKLVGFCIWEISLFGVSKHLRTSSFELANWVPKCLSFMDCLQYLNVSYFVVDQVLGMPIKNRTNHDWVGWRIFSDTRIAL